MLRPQPQLYPLYDPVHLIGVVQVIESKEKALYTVVCDGKAWVCTRAASCLLQPALGDTVLISGPDAQRVYLLAVIEQAQPQQSVMDFAGAVTVQAPQFDMRTQQANWQVEQLQYVGKKITAHVGWTQLFARVYERTCDRLRSLSRRSVRVTKEVEKSRAGTVDMQAEQALRLHAEFTSMTAKEIVKVDGKQIHMG